MAGWNIKYPYVNDEILNLDWVLSKLKEMDEALGELTKGGFAAIIEQYFNQIMIDAIYHEDIEQIELKKVLIGDGLHIYDADEEQMEIDGE